MSTYPSEAYPPDVDIQALDGTTDPVTGLSYIAKGVGPNSTPTYEIQYNRRQHRQNTVLAAIRQGMVVDEGSLAIGVYPIRYTLGGTRKTFDGATNQSVADNATKKVYLDSSNTLQIQDAFPGDITTYLPLATVVTANGAMTITDERPLVLFTVPN
jgi:hypothetical protein